MNGRPQRKGYERSTDPLTPLRISAVTWERYQRQATQRVLRSAVDGHWSGATTRDVLEALGLIEPAPSASAPQPTPERPSTALSGAKSGHAEPGWCGSGMHAMVGDNVYVDPLGRTECRQCRRNRKRRGGAE